MKIDHIAIWVKDLEMMRKFYEKYFEAKSSDIYSNIENQYSSYFLSFQDGARLEIMKMPSIPESKNNPDEQFTGFIHLSISVGSKEQVDAITSQLAKDGHTVVENARNTGDGYYESTVFDPEQNRIEITK